MWLLDSIPAYKRSGADNVKLTANQLMALMQFANTGPDTTSLVDMHAKLHKRDGINHRPKKKISIRRFRHALDALYKYRSVLRRPAWSGLDRAARGTPGRSGPVSAERAPGDAPAIFLRY